MTQEQARMALSDRRAGLAECRNDNPAQFVAVTAERPSTDRHADLVAERLRVLGQPLRLRLVERLAIEPTTVRELVNMLKTTQQNVSQHLGILRRAGIVARHKEGTRVRYELVDPHILPLLEQAKASLAHQLGELAQQIQPSGVVLSGKPKAAAALLSAP